MGRSSIYKPKTTAHLSYFPMINTNATGKRIRELRKQHGLKVKEVQELLGLSTDQAVYKWESGSSMPTIDNLVVLSRVLQTKIDDILVIQDVWISKAG